MALTLTLKQIALTNVEDAAGGCLYEGGEAFENGQLVAYYASAHRVVPGGTNAQNTAMVTVTIFFLGKQPPENITLQGSHEYNLGNEIGSVSAASSAFAIHIGKQFSRVNDILTIH